MALVVQWVDGEGGGKQSATAAITASDDDWVYAIATLRQRPGVDGQVQVGFYAWQTQATTALVNVSAGLPALMPRNSTIGRGYGGQGGAGFVGEVDTLRLYPYALTANEALLQFELSSPAVVTPVVWGHFAMQPMESNEATFSHRGVASHLAAHAIIRQPPRTSDLFPGWAHLNGVDQAIDLSNPGNGVNALWTTDVSHGSQALSLELWVRPDAAATSAATLLDAWPVVRVQVAGDGTLGVQWSTGQGQGNVSVDAAVQPGQWTHVVWTADGTTATVFVDGAQAAAAKMQGALVAAAPAHAWLGRGGDGMGWYEGSVGAFRVYNVTLGMRLVARLYAAQMDHSRPAPPMDSSTADGSSGGAVGEYGGGGGGGDGVGAVDDGDGGGGGAGAAGTGRWWRAGMCCIGGRGRGRRRRPGLVRDAGRMGGPPHCSARTRTERCEGPRGGSGVGRDGVHRRRRPPAASRLYTSLPLVCFCVAPRAGSGTGSLLCCKSAAPTAPSADEGSGILCGSVERSTVAAESE